MARLDLGLGHRHRRSDRVVPGQVRDNHCIGREQHDGVLLLPSTLSLLLPVGSAVGAAIFELIVMPHKLRLPA
jgi:hypothetical protein